MFRFETLKIFKIQLFAIFFIYFFYFSQIFYIFLISYYVNVWYSVISKLYLFSFRITINLVNLLIGLWTFHFQLRRYIYFHQVQFPLFLAKKVGTSFLIFTLNLLICKKRSKYIWIYINKKIRSIMIHAGYEVSDYCRKNYILTESGYTIFSAMLLPSYPTWISKESMLLLIWATSTHQ